MNYFCLFFIDDTSAVKVAEKHKKYTIFFHRKIHCKLHNYTKSAYKMWPKSSQKNSKINQMQLCNPFIRNFRNARNSSLKQKKPHILMRKRPYVVITHKF